jgi:NAD(P)-dependent dehydrogenase (short-subunit alcohol dehydrogenase family)
LDLGLQTRTALVVGATGGIGGAVCAALVDERVGRLALGVRSLDQGEELAAKLRARGSTEVSVMRCDLANADDARSAVEAAAPDLLVMAAGAPTRGKLWDVDAEAWAAAIDTKLMGAVRFLHAAIPPMVERGFGRVVMVGGLNGRKPAGTGVIGGVVNAGLASLTTAVARDVAAAGVTVNLVDPNSVRTGRWDRRVAKLAEQTGQTPEQVAADLLKSVPAGRPTRAEDVAGMIVFLLSDLASSVTGIAVPVDGGANPNIY